MGNRSSNTAPQDIDRARDAASDSRRTEELRVAIVTSIHQDFDQRIWRYASMTRRFAETHLVCPWRLTDGEIVEGVHFHTFVGSTSRRTRYRTTWRVLRRLLPILPKMDIVHFHDIDLLPLMIILSAFKPVVYDVHENYADEMLIRHWIPNRLRRLLYYTIVAGHWVAARTIGNIVMVVPDQIEQFHGAKRMLLIRNYATEERSREAAADYLSRPMRVISTASQYPANGTWVLLEIAERLLERAPHVVVTVVDRFPDPAFRAEILHAIEKRALINIEFVPQILATRIMEYLNCTRIGVIPSLNVPRSLKAIPTRLFEYMAAGIPVVASSHPHIVSVIRDTGCGFCCDPDAPDTFVDAILRLIDEPLAAERMGAAGKAAFRDRYTWESQQDALERFYAEIVTSRMGECADGRAGLHVES